jgi:hypothetical protein
MIGQKRPGADPGFQVRGEGGHLKVRIQGFTWRPPKIRKNMIFWRKIVIFHTKYPQNFCASLRNWKKYDFLA